MSKISKVEYDIRVRFEISKQPTIQGIIEECNLYIIFENGKYVTCQINWENVLTIENCSENLSHDELDEIELYLEILPDKLHENITSNENSYKGEYCF